MPTADSTLSALSPDDRQALEAWLVEFDCAWTQDSLPARLRDLPATGWRAAALVEMVKIDLERQWRRSKPLLLEHYLRVCPELGSPETVSAELIAVEYAIRRECGDTVSEAEYAQRFPTRIAEFERHRAVTRIAPIDTTARGGRASASRPRQSDSLGLTAPLSPQQLPEHFGRYRILRRLGGGGMGTVYLAHDSQLDRQVALKVPHFSATDGPEVIERFYREARAAAALRHPNICPVYDAASIDGVHFLTMAYLEGEQLSHVLARRGAIDQRSAASIVARLAGALAEAHGRGIVHRDLKPANIMLAANDEPVILDFGLARRLESPEAQLTQAGALVGTPAYMSPEQVRGDAGALGPSCDIYALGVILYELLTGARPFDGAFTTVLAKVLTESPPPLSQRREGLDPRLEAICHTAMARLPAERYPRAEDLANALRAWLQGEPDSTTAAFRRSRRLRRSKALLAYGLLAAPICAALFYATGVLSQGDAAIPPAVGVAGDDLPQHVAITVPPPAVAPFDSSQARGHQEAWATYLKTTVETTHPLGFKLALIPPGEFTMGASDEEIGHVVANTTSTKSAYFEGFIAETRGQGPPHSVTLSRPLWLATTEVTVSQFRKFVEATQYKTDAERDGKGGILSSSGGSAPHPEITWSNPGHEQSDDCPVVQVSWNDAVEFCNWLSRQQGLTPAYFGDGFGWLIAPKANGYRLPTEAEWEFACRAGTTTRFFCGDDEAAMGYYAWAGPNGQNRTHPVATKLPNHFGLYDIQGNVREWVHDWYDDTFFTRSPAVDPTGPATGTLHVVRGGSWSHYRLACRSASRSRGGPTYRFDSIGFRVARGL